MEATEVRSLTLRGWKEIAAYTGRDVRTVQRWELRGLPIRRVPGSEKGNVYALSSEIEAWLHPPLAEEPKAAPLPDLPPVDAVIQQAKTQKFDWQRGVLLLACFGLVTLVAAATLRFRPQESEGIAKSGALNSQLSSSYTHDPGYVQAIELFNQRTPDSLLAADHLFRELVQKNPDNAPAWSGLAQTLTVIGAYNMQPENSAQTEAREAAERALVLDPSLSEPHAVLGFSDFFWLGHPAAADAEFQKALSLPSKSAMVYSWYGTMLTYEAHYDEALGMFTKAEQMKPNFVPTLAAKAFALGLNGKRNEAVRMLRSLEQKDPLPSVRYYLATLSLIVPRDSMTFLNEEINLSQISHNYFAVRDFRNARSAYLQGGEPAMWRQLEETHPRGVLGIEAEAALGHTDQALASMQHQASHEPQALSSIALDPVLAPLLRDPRFMRTMHPSD